MFPLKEWTDVFWTFKENTEERSYVYECKFEVKSLRVVRVFDGSRLLGLFKKNPKNWSERMRTKEVEDIAC